MNKYKKALNTIGDTLTYYMVRKDLNQLPSDNEIFDSMDTLRELVERATPKKLVATRHTRRCPACNRQMSDINNAHPNMKFCPNCGQTLDWRDEDDC